MKNIKFDVKLERSVSSPDTNKKQALLKAFRFYLDPLQLQ